MDCETSPVLDRPPLEMEQFSNGHEVADGLSSGVEGDSKKSPSQSNGDIKPFSNEPRRMLSVRNDTQGDNTCIFRREKDMQGAEDAEVAFARMPTGSSESAESTSDAPANSPDDASKSNVVAKSEDAISRAYFIDWMRLYANFGVMWVHLWGVTPTTGASSQTLTQMNTGIRVLVTAGMPLYFVVSGWSTSTSGARYPWRYIRSRTIRLFRPFFLYGIPILTITDYLLVDTHWFCGDISRNPFLFVIEYWFSVDKVMCHGFLWLWFIPVIWLMGIISLPFAAWAFNESFYGLVINSIVIGVFAVVIGLLYSLPAAAIILTMNIIIVLVAPLKRRPYTYIPIVTAGCGALLFVLVDGFALQLPLISDAVYAGFLYSVFYVIGMSVRLLQMKAKREHVEEELSLPTEGDAATRRSPWHQFVERVSTVYVRSTPAVNSTVKVIVPILFLFLLSGLFALLPLSPNDRGLWTYHPYSSPWLMFCWVSFAFLMLAYMWAIFLQHYNQVLNMFVYYHLACRSPLYLYIFHFFWIAVWRILIPEDIIALSPVLFCIIGMPFVVAGSVLCYIICTGIDFCIDWLLAFARRQWKSVWKARHAEVDESPSSPTEYKTVERSNGRE
jgi:hypothetical protein